MARDAPVAYEIREWPRRRALGKFLFSAEFGFAEVGALGNEEVLLRACVCVEICGKVMDIWVSWESCTDYDSLNV